MPQLGMTQDSGAIVTWHKAPGDEVTATDILMEVETDKATMEVEAGCAGFLLEIRAGAGSTVPVGDVVAVISDDATGVIAAPAPIIEEADVPVASSAPPPAPMTVDIPPPPVVPATLPALKATQPPLVSDGKILASPKARFQAHQRGIDLGDLAHQGVPQPFHARDVETFVPQTTDTSVAAASVLKANVARNKFDTIVARAMETGENHVNFATVWAAFIAKSYRARTDMTFDDALIVDIISPMDDEGPMTLRDPDLSGLSSPVLCEHGSPAAFSVRDLSASTLSDYRPGLSGEALAFVITAIDDNTYDLSLCFFEDQLPLPQAVSMLEHIAQTAADPVRHLL